MRVSAPWIRTVILDDLDDGNYVIANQVFIYHVKDDVA